MIAAVAFVLCAQVAEPAAAAAPAPASEPSSSTATRPERYRRVAIYDLRAEGVEPRIARFVTDSLVVELRKLDGMSVVSMEEVRALLDHDAQLQLMGCDDGHCASPVGEALGVDEILVGSVGVVAGSSVMTLRRIDHQKAKAIATITRRLKPADGEEYLAEVGPSIDALFPGHTLRAGSTRGVPPERVRRLNPPPLPLWAPIATGAAAVVALAGGATFGVFALDAEQAHANFLAQAKTTEVPGAVVNDARERALSFATGANVLYGAAAVVSLAAGAMIPFTNFDVETADDE